MANCSVNYGGTDSSEFGKPLPWIGLYVATATLACFLLMTVDLLRSFKWRMALTSSPDYALRSSEQSFCCSILNASFLTYPSVLVINSFSGGDPLRCFYRSDYKWSTWAIFLLQFFAIAVGCLSSFFRGTKSSVESLLSFFRGLESLAGSLSSSDLFRAWRNLFKIEKYRYELMMDWNDRPLPAWISNKRIRQNMRNLRRVFLGVLIKLQVLVITLTRIILILFAFITFILLMFPSRLFMILRKCCKRRRDGTTNASMNVDMSRYVLYLEDEKDIEKSKLIAETWQKYPSKWIARGGSNQPTNLDSLLRNDSLPDAIRAVYEFYSSQISPVEPYRKPPNCWALPIVTLASILYATSPSNRENLMLAVGESLRYIRLVDENMDERGTGRMQKAADIAWEKLYLQNRWMNVDFVQTTSMTFNGLIIRLHTEAENGIRQDCNNNEYWPMTAFIANCMYTTTEIILDRNGGGVSSDLFWSVERLEKVMVGLLSACLTNLQFAIFKHCSSGTFGLREDKVRDAATILGETRRIVELLEVSDQVVNYPVNKEYFESWCGRSPFPQSYA